MCTINILKLSKWSPDVCFSISLSIRLHLGHTISRISETGYMYAEKNDNKWMHLACVMMCTNPNEIISIETEKVFTFIMFKASIYVNESIKEMVKIDIISV